MKFIQINLKQRRIFGRFAALLIILLVGASPCHAEQGAGEGAATDVSAQELTAEPASGPISTMQERVSENRLVNRSTDEIVAFVLVGLLVASVAGFFSNIPCSTMGICIRIGLGLIGAYVGGMLVHVAQIDFGWSEVVISYEKLLFSLLGAAAVVAISRFIQKQWKNYRSNSESQSNASS